MNFINTLQFVMTAGFLATLMVSPAKVSAETDKVSDYRARWDNVRSAEIVIQKSPVRKNGLSSAHIWFQAGDFRADVTYQSPSGTDVYQRKYIFPSDSGRCFCYDSETFSTGGVTIGEYRGVESLNCKLAPPHPWKIASIPWYFDVLRPWGKPVFFGNPNWRLNSSDDDTQIDDAEKLVFSDGDRNAEAVFENSTGRLLSLSIGTDESRDEIELSYNGNRFTIPRQRIFRKVRKGETQIEEMLEIQVISENEEIPSTIFKLESLGIPEGHPFTSAGDGGNLQRVFYKEGSLVEIDSPISRQVRDREAERHISPLLIFNFVVVGVVLFLVGARWWTQR